MAQGNARPEKRDIAFKLGANEILSPAIPARSLEARKLSVNRKRCGARTLSIMLCLLEGLHQEETASSRQWEDFGLRKTSRSPTSQQWAKQVSGTVGLGRGSCRPAPRKREQLRVTKQRPAVCRRDIARLSRRMDRRRGSGLGADFRHVETNDGTTSEHALYRRTDIHGCPRSPHRGWHRCILARDRTWHYVLVPQRRSYASILTYDSGSVQPPVSPRPRVFAQ